VAYNKEATRWLGVYLDSSLTRKEHHRTRMRKARQAEGRLRRLTGQFGMTPEHCRRILVSCVQASALFGSELWWTNGRGVRGQANDIQLMVNRQTRSTTGTDALVAEAGLRPATSLLDNRQRRFALRLAGLPSSDQARCVVVAKDAFGQQLERALWTPAGSPGPLEATTLMTTGDHLFGEVIIEDTDAAATRMANEWQGTAIWTDGSRLEDGSVGCAVAWNHPEHDAWTGVLVHIYDVELHAIYRAMLTLFQESRGQKMTIFWPPRQPYRGLHPTHQVQDSDTLSQSHNRHTAYGSNEKSPSNSGGSPAMQAPPATRRPASGQRWQHGINAARSNCLASSAARPWPT